MHWFLYYCRRQHSVATANAANVLMRYVFSKMNGIDECYLDVIKASIRLLLFSLSNIEILRARNELDTNEFEGVYKNCEVVLKGWAERVMADGWLFGSKAVYGSSNNTELKVC